MTRRPTPDGTPQRVLRLPVRDVIDADAPPRAVSGSVTSLPGRAAAAPAPSRPDAVDLAPPPRSAPDSDDDAVLALLSARLSFEAATAATGRVRLPSLTDFLG